MNRELKFRIWDKRNKRFHFPNDYEFPINDREEVYSAPVGIFFAGWNYINNDKDLIVQQYTGLKDKNGKEIYEGDIIKVTYKMDEHGELEDFTDTVIFYEGSFGTKDDTLFNWSFAPGFSMEVVGNIYETN